MHAPSSIFQRPLPAAAAIAILCTTVSAQVQTEGAADRPICWQQCMGQRPEWYGGDEALRIADNVLLYQHSMGGWPKNIDMARVIGDDEAQKIRDTKESLEPIIDNGATYTQIRFLARVYRTTGQGRLADACRRGVEYLLKAQYPSGGWPMIYPLQQGYYTHIDFNDGAMIGVMRLLKDAAAGQEPLDFFDSNTRERCQRAIDKGLDCILKCQVKVDGKPTVWCAQHDEFDFKPAQARSYELPSLSGQKSVGIVEYLMELSDPSPEVRRVVEGAVAWFDQVKIEGEAVKLVTDPKAPRGRDHVVVEDPKAPPLWARFYEIGTNRPLFVGRDGVVHDHLADIEVERRAGYAYLGSWTSELLARDYPDWKKKWGGK